MTKFAVLRERDFRWFFIGSAASIIGDYMAPVAIVFAVLEIGGAGDVGLVLAARIVPLIAFMLVGGVIADRLPRKAVMIGADLVRAAGQGLLAYLLLSGNAQVWELAALQVAHGTASAMFTPAITGLVQQTVPAARLQEANSLRGLAGSAGSVAGPAVAGALVAFAGPGWAVAIDAAGFAVSAYCLGRLPSRVVGASPWSFHGMLSDLRDGWREFVARRWVWTIVAVASLMNMFQAAYTVLGPVEAVNRLGGPAVWGLVLACGGAGAMLGGLITLWLRPYRPLRAAVLAVTLFPAPILALALGLPAFGVAAAALAGGCGLIVFNTLWETTLQQSIPQDRLSRVSAYEWFGSYACNPIGLLLVPAVSARAGHQAVLWASGTAMVALAASLFLVPEVRAQVREQVLAGG
ncbi:MFS transporter [Streptosporangiaceae bacterium NEAU-GS5]|nr:MFS transporter [Streptosporangiaceae bacterium NEAU-GS5]